LFKELAEGEIARNQIVRRMPGQGKRILIGSCAEREKSARDTEFMGFVTGHDFSRAAGGRRGYGGL
jgi:hypothetical protein